MASSPSVVVIHSSKIQEDRKALLAIFTEDFQVEASSQSSAVLLHDEQLTLILAPCEHAKGTYTSIILEKETIKRVRERAKLYSISTTPLETDMILLTLPGGATLLATAPELWTDSSSRRAVLEKIGQIPYDINRTREIVQSHRSPNFRPRSVNSKAMKRSLSLPQFPHLDSSPNIGLFPSLETKVLTSEDRYTHFPLNSETPIPVETDFFAGSAMFIMRPRNPEADPFWNERIFSKKKRRIIFQLQGKLRRKPVGDVFAGLEISDPMNLGLLASGMCNIILKLVQKFNPNVHYSFGDSSERPHICFPASTFFERLVVTPPGQQPPPFGEDFEEPLESIKSRKANKATIDWNTDDTYSMSFHSMYIDFPTWSVVGLPIGKDIQLETFWRKSLASIVLYEVNNANKKHLTSTNKYLLGVQMKYLGENGALPIDDPTNPSAWSEDKFVEVDMESDSSAGEVGLANPILEGEEDEDLPFFDAAQELRDSTTGAQSIGELSEQILLSPSSSLTTVLRAIDESCPFVIDMCGKRGKYVHVYALRGPFPTSRPLFRSYDSVVKLLGDPHLTDLEEKFSDRLSSIEKNRRALGLRYHDALRGVTSTEKLVEFRDNRSVFDVMFLKRKGPPSERFVGLKTGFVARALSDRHWIEQLCLLTEDEILFYHPGKSKPEFRMSLNNVINVQKMSKNDEPLLDYFSYLLIETFGRTTYLMFRSSDERDSWETLIVNREGKGSIDFESSNSITNHLVSMDEPTQEFLHNSSMWDCQKRRILNCRKFSFRTPREEDKPNALELAETALVKATALQPKGPNDADLEEFLDCAAALKEADAYSLDEDERTAFFLNVYHVMIMHAFIVLGPPDSSLKWPTYFNSISYHVSDDIFSLAELEHNIIRAEMSYPAQFLSRFVLPKSKYLFAVSRRDPRLNFALNCGSLSCPSGAVPVYKADTISEQLDATSRSFLHDTVTVKPKGAKDVSLTLPRICQWFANDFGEGTLSSVLEVIQKHLSSEKREILKITWREHKQMYDIGIFNIKYLPYSFECRFLTLLDDKGAKNKM